VNARSAACVLMLGVLALASPAAAKKKPVHKGKTWTWTFQADTLGIAPPGTAIFGGTWEVIVDSTVAAPGASGDSADAAADSAAAPKLLRQNDSDDGEKYHYIQFKKPVVHGMTASVRFRILSGDLDPSVGLLFQLDPKGKNGYLVRVRRDDGDVAAHYLMAGKRRDLKFAKIDPPELGTWHTLSVSREGSILTASYDGMEVIRIRDERFSKGSVGLWAEYDTRADYADLTLKMQ
jgi:hypothetical protein